MFDTSHFHPMIVHFPVALLAVGFLADVISLFFSKKEPCLSKIGFYLMILGTLGAVAAFLTGEYFTQEMAGAAGELKERHELYAKITMYVMIVASVLRMFAVFTHRDKGALKWFVFFLYACGAATVGLTGFLGGSLLYNYMIGF